MPADYRVIIIIIIIIRESNRSDEESQSAIKSDGSFCRSAVSPTAAVEESAGRRKRGPEDGAGSYRNRGARNSLTRFRVRARRPKAGPFYGRACSRDRQLPGRQAALLFASPTVEERSRRPPPPPPPSFSSFFVFCSQSFLKLSRGTEARSAVAPRPPEDRLGARLPRGNAPFIHVSLIHRHARRGPGRNLRSLPT